MFIVHVHCSLFMFIVHCSHGATLIFDDVFSLVSHFTASYKIQWPYSLPCQLKTVAAQDCQGTEGRRMS